MENCTIYMHRKERGKGRERDLQCGQDLSKIAKILVFITNLQFHEFLFASKYASSNTSPLEAHAGFFRLLMKGIFDPYVACTAL